MATRRQIFLFFLCVVGLAWSLSPAEAQPAPAAAVCTTAVATEGAVIGGAKWVASYEANVQNAISAHLQAGRSHVELTSLSDPRFTLVCAW